MIRKLSNLALIIALAFTVALAQQPGGSTTSVAASGGVATFSNLHLNTAGGYTIAASSSDGSMLRKMPTVIRNTTPTPRMASTKIMPSML